MSEVHATFPAKSAGRAPVERRAWLRYENPPATDGRSLSARVTVETKSTWLARLHDVSAGGIGLLPASAIRAGSPAERRRDDEARTFGSKLSARVVRATEQPGWAVARGCEFTQPLTDGELCLLLPAG